MNRQIQQRSNRAWRNNVTLVMAMSFFQVFLVIMPVMVPFFHSRGLDMQDVFILQAMFAVLVLVLEIPSGYVADLWGRRNALLMGALFCGLGHTVLLFADGFWELALFEAGMAVAKSLVSGADLALAYDSALASGRKQSDDIVGRLYGWRTGAEAVAAVVCSLILLFAGLPEVVIAQAAVGWVPLLLAWWLVEPPIESQLEGGHAAQHLENFRRVIRHIGSRGPVIKLTIAVWCLWGLTTYFSVWLLQKIWLIEDLALHHFGYLWAGYMLLASITGRVALTLEAWFGARALLVFCGIAPILGYVGLVNGSLVVGILVGMLFFAARGVGYVLLQDAFNSRMPSQYRATANSMLSFGVGLASAVTGPFVGWAVDAWPLHIALWMLAGYATLVFVGLVVPLALKVRPTTRPATA